MNMSPITSRIRAQLPGVMAIYAFGSRVVGNAGPGSDLDLAVLVPGYVDPLVLWQLAGDLSDEVGCPVDLLDFRRASTVMQHQILRTGLRCWVHEPAAVDGYEATLLNEYIHLNEARQDLLSDIERRGYVYGR